MTATCKLKTSLHGYSPITTDRPRPTRTEFGNVHEVEERKAPLRNSMDTLGKYFGMFSSW
ncbi:hypothetical protein P3T76_002830 [Phytophthora citrophthora]|uniref:Uncharacterized protein n=1 Tax=Phytophthora citrophthora TaxID=4793 RepID=A0AAD9GVZ1_9STRA|nr:hypothetical protein P3T76_002830 [Phytophthora citrophthora]